MTFSAEKRLKTAAIYLVIGGLCVVAAGFGYLHLTPEIFQAAAKIRVWQTGRIATNSARGTFDAALLARSECQVLRSDAVLDRAARSLGAPWNQPGGRERLRQATEAGPLPDSGVIQIIATGGDRAQVAAIANEIGRAYCDYHETARDQTTRENLDVLQKQLDALNPKVLEAWTNLSRACANFTPSTNGSVLYDSGSYLALESNRARLDLAVSNQAQRLSQLKAMNRGQLRQALPVLDGRTNAVLAAGLGELNKAQADLAATRTQHGPDSVEVQQAVQAVAQLETSVDRAANAALLAQDLKLDSLKTSLAVLDQRLANATTNKSEVIRAHPELAAPARELEKLEAERDALEMKIKLEDSAQASLPVTTKTDLIESAEPPHQPVSPDARIANSAMLAGGLLIAGGLFLRLLPKPKLVPVKPH